MTDKTRITQYKIASRLIDCFPFGNLQFHTSVGLATLLFWSMVTLAGAPGVEGVETVVVSVGGWRMFDSNVVSDPTHPLVIAIMADNTAGSA